MPTLDDKAAGNWLMKTMRAFLGRNDPSQAAGNAYIQSTMAQCSAQAIVNLLRQKNIVSEGELKRALAEAYMEREQKFHDQSVIAAPAPQVITPGSTN